MILINHKILICLTFAMKIISFLFIVLFLSSYSNAEIIRLTSKSNRVCVDTQCYRESTSHTNSAQFVFKNNKHKKYLNAEVFNGILRKGENHRNYIKLEEGYRYLLDEFHIPKTNKINIAFNIIFNQPMLITIKDNNKILAETTKQNYYQTFNIKNQCHHIEILLTALTQMYSNPKLNKGFDHTRKVWLWYQQDNKQLNYTSTGVRLMNLTTSRSSSILYRTDSLN